MAQGNGWNQAVSGRRGWYTSAKVPRREGGAACSAHATAPGAHGTTNLQVPTSCMHCCVVGRPRAQHLFAFGPALRCAARRSSSGAWQPPPTRRWWPSTPGWRRPSRTQRYAQPAPTTRSRGPSEGAGHPCPLRWRTSHGHGGRWCSGRACGGGSLARHGGSSQAGLYTSTDIYLVAFWGASLVAGLVRPAAACSRAGCLARRYFLVRAVRAVCTSESVWM